MSDYKHQNKEFGSTGHGNPNYKVSGPFPGTKEVLIGDPFTIKGFRTLRI